MQTVLPVAVNLRCKWCEVLGGNVELVCSSEVKGGIGLLKIQLRLQGWLRVPVLARVSDHRNGSDLTCVFISQWQSIQLLPYRRRKL